MPFRVQIVTSGYNGGPGYMNLYTNAALVTDVAPWLATVDAFVTGMKPVTANGVTITRSGNVEQFDPVSGQTVGIVSGAPFSTAGTWGTSQAPQGTALVLRWRTGQYINGREVRGRTYWSGLGDFGNATGGVPAAQVTAAQVAMDNIRAGGFGAVYSPTHQTLRPLNAVGCWDKFGLIRSRRD